MTYFLWFVLGLGAYLIAYGLKLLCNPRCTWEGTFKPLLPGLVLCAIAIHFLHL